ncbi:hypothetical protein D3C84_938110 [compost metagenome]
MRQIRSWSLTPRISQSSHMMALGSISRWNSGNTLTTTRPPEMAFSISGSTGWKLVPGALGIQNRL